MKANGVFAEFDHPALGVVPTVNNPINVNGVVKEKPRLAPEIGQHSREILVGLGCEDRAIKELIRREVIAAPADSEGRRQKTEVVRFRQPDPSTPLRKCCPPAPWAS